MRDQLVLKDARNTGPPEPPGPLGLPNTEPFNPFNASSYVPGQVVTYEGSSYVVDTADPLGTPGTSPEFTLLVSIGSTGATGVTGESGLTGETSRYYSDFFFYRFSQLSTYNKTGILEYKHPLHKRFIEGLFEDEVA
ncbi:hypothetical protein [Paenibacillus sp. FSL K6-2862]|uniref:hypothetical protein n=1 Tax=Paenibacillus sp. FSL K6-2862 TaxID=2921484 RepID=UPI0030F4D0F9